MPNILFLMAAKGSELIFSRFLIKLNCILVFSF
nr:MAG TPA: hypothetical protein [Caudoviricetes sp.]